MTSKSSTVMLYVSTIFPFYITYNNFRPAYPQAWQMRPRRTGSVFLILTFRQAHRRRAIWSNISVSPLSLVLLNRSSGGGRGVIFGPNWPEWHSTITVFLVRLVFDSYFNFNLYLQQRQQRLSACSPVAIIYLFSPATVLVPSPSASCYALAAGARKILWGMKILLKQLKSRWGLGARSARLRIRIAERVRRFVKMR